MKKSGYIYYLLVVFLFSVYQGNGQNISIDFKYLTDENGLPSNGVYSILSDSKGFVWFGTQKGLCQYDGYSLKILKQNSKLSGAEIKGIRSLEEDRKGHIWISSSTGIVVYNYLLDTFKIIVSEKEIAPGSRKNSILKDNLNRIWLIYNNSIYKYNYNKDSVNKKQLDGFDTTKKIITSVIDHKNRLWLGTNHSAYCYTIDNANTLYPVKEINLQLPNTKTIRAIFEDENHTIWIGSDNKSLYSWSKENGFKHHTGYKGPRINVISSFDPWILWIITPDGPKLYNTLLEKEIPYKAINYNPDLSKMIISECKGRDNVMWFGTNHSGVVYCKKNISQFKTYTKIKNDGNQLPLGPVYGFFKKSDNEIWVCSQEGMHLLGDLSKNRHGFFYPNAITVLKTKHPYIPLKDIRKKDMFLLNENQKWVNNQKWLLKKQSVVKDSSLINEKIWGSIIDDNGLIWATTYKHGLVIFDPVKKTLIHKKNLAGFPERIFNSTKLNYLFKDKNGNIWLFFTGKNKLFRYNKDNTLQTIRLAKNKKATSPKLNFIFENKHGDLFAGTNHGLLKLNDSLNNSEHIKVGGVSFSVPVYSIEEDGSGYLWLATSKGLFKISPKTFKIVYSAVQHGMTENRFEPNSSVKLNNGMLCFGHADGFILFDPDNIKESITYPPLIFTEFKLLGKSADFYKTGSLLSKPINETNEIELDHRQNSFEIEFGVIDYFNKEGIKYFYKLKGHHKRWIRNGTNRQVFFSNISPGFYTFMVKLSDPLGNPSQVSRNINIVIHPPFWERVWFRTVVISIILLLFYAAHRIRINTHKRRSAFLEREVNIRTSQLNQSNNELQSANDKLLEQKNIAIEQRDQLKNMVNQVNELSRSKIDFFTNISHELLTPLTLVIGPMERMLKIQKEKLSFKQYWNNFSAAFKNAKRLLRLVNQLLEFQKVETGILGLRLQKKDVVYFIKDLIDSMINSAKHKGVSLLFHSSTPSCNIPFDQDKFEKILFNLTGNAVKFCKNGDTVNVFLDINENGNTGEVIIIVSDTGEGIPEDKLSQIFDRFYTLKKNTSNTSGFGIGLSYVKDLVDFLNGSIEVESKPAEGTKFKVVIPYDMDAYITKSHTKADFNQQIEPLSENDFSDVPINSEEITIQTDSPDKNGLILIVEDDIDIRNFIAQSFEKPYNVMVAGNGIEALKILESNEVNLIVSDIMMPEMDGIEFCEQVKSNILTCHIPIILLTAKSLVENKVEGYKTGADDYIIKPFNDDLLLSRVNNLIESRKTLKEKFKKDFITEPVPFESPSLDEEFLLKLNKYLEQEYSNPDLGVEELSSEMAFSYSQLIRKLKALLGMTPKEYIYVFRLKKAATMLKTGKYNIIEVSELTGFKSHSGFTKSFRNYFGVTPSDYIR